MKRARTGSRETVRPSAPSLSDVPSGSAVEKVNIQLLSPEDQPLLDRWDSLLLLDALLYARDLDQ